MVAKAVTYIVIVNIVVLFLYLTISPGMTDQDSTQNKPNDFYDHPRSTLHNSVRDNGLRPRNSLKDAATQPAANPLDDELDPVHQKGINHEEPAVITNTQVEDNLDEELDDALPDANIIPDQQTQPEPFKTNQPEVPHNTGVQLNLDSTNLLAEFRKVMPDQNPLELLGYYDHYALEDWYTYEFRAPDFTKYGFGIIRDENYCKKADFYALSNIDHLLGGNIIFSEYNHQDRTRDKVIAANFVDSEPYCTKSAYPNTINLNPNVNMFFMHYPLLQENVKFGVHFACATQSYNHIPGHQYMVRKDTVANTINEYGQNFVGREQCFTPDRYTPRTYRLYNFDECTAWFKDMYSKAYNKRAKEEGPIQYIIKVGNGSSRARGVYLLDREIFDEIEEAYGHKGALCGVETTNLIAQRYINNPLLLDMDNKFDFRTYLLIASTNPLIAYYHDGYVRTSLETFNKTSLNKKSHLTNTAVVKEVVANMKDDDKYKGMNKQELLEYQIWSLERLQQFLLSTGKITDTNWLDNYLRPAFKKVFIHTARLTYPHLIKNSNVFEMFGLDFMIDDEFHLWFIESNWSPQFDLYNDQFMVPMLTDLINIQLAYQRSRMKRVVNVIKNMTNYINKTGDKDINKFKQEFQEALKNKLEPEYAPQSSSFDIIIDQNRQGADAYFGYIEPECA